MKILIRTSDVAAAEPNAHSSRFHNHRGVADHLGVPRLVAGDDQRLLLPADSVAGAGKQETAHLGAIASCIQHPVRAKVGPDGGLAQAASVSRSVFAEFEDRVVAQLRPTETVVGDSDTQAL